MKYETCKKCGTKVEMYKCINTYQSSLHSGGLCLACYEKEFDKMSEEEKKPNFAGVVNPF